DLIDAAIARKAAKENDVSSARVLVARKSIVERQVELVWPPQQAADGFYRKRVGHWSLLVYRACLSDKLIHSATLPCMRDRVAHAHGGLLRRIAAGDARNVFDLTPVDLDQ